MRWRGSRRLALAAWLALLLAQGLSQGLALLHAVGHGVVVQAALQPRAAEPWGHDAGDAQCRLVDALLAIAPGSARAACVSLLSRAEPPPAGVVPTLALRRLRLFEARAPPLS